MTDSPVAMRFRQVGSRALLVELDDLMAASAVHRWIIEHGSAAAEQPRDVVPAARTVLVDGIDPGVWRDLLARQAIRRAAAPAGDRVSVPTHYDGPDLDEVARAWSCSVDEVVGRHSGAAFVVAFCGFAPGFAYCTPLEPLPPVPRRSEPRERVPAGSVALGGEFCGLYPNEMPGGWLVIGRTDERLFDPARSKPALLQPGDLVRFEIVP